MPSPVTSATFICRGSTPAPCGLRFAIGLVFECLEPHRRDGFARRIKGQYLNMIMFVFDHNDIRPFVAVDIAGGEIAVGAVFYLCFIAEFLFEPIRFVLAPGGITSPNFSPSNSRISSGPPPVREAINILTPDAGFHVPTSSSLSKRICFVCVRGKNLEPALLAIQ